MSIPVIDIEPLKDPKKDPNPTYLEIKSACTKSGFFYITGHGVSRKLQKALEDYSWQFFNQPEASKLSIAMSKGGKAWRGYFPVGAELTSGDPDLKEGLYFGEQLSAKHKKVIAGTPLHGLNLFPGIDGFADTVLEYFDQMTALGKLLMRGIGLSLRLKAEFFEEQYMMNPLKLFRIFHYPAPVNQTGRQNLWGVGEHTDYGVLTILKQDATGGLQVYTQNQWIEAPYIENTFICNIGDMLDLMTKGYYRSTPHRVLNKSEKGRLSFPFFYDLDFDCYPKPLDLNHLGHSEPLEYRRWDQTTLQAFSGSYGEYLVSKVSKVFPELRDNML